MKLTEIFEKSGIEQDDKSRRIVNTSRATARITADEIEAGVSLERIEQTLGVPVYRYATQITIHGVVPGFSDEARPAGYKSVFRNANGSVGVRYVAIDAAKKQTIVDASHYGEKGWTARIDSQGLSISRYFEEKAACIAAYKAFPREMIYGSVIAAACQFGGYCVLAEVGAIPSKMLWPFIQTLWGLPSEESLAARIAEEQTRRDSERKVFEQQMAERSAATARAKKDYATTVTRSRIHQIPAGACTFLVVASTLKGIGLLRYTVAKRGPVLCCRVDPFPADESAPREGKFRKFDAPWRERLQKLCSEGLVFTV